MLARFGLPHLRIRTVRLFLGDEYQGLYDLLEAPDQDYVHQRSFPGFDPASYGLYKVKTMSLLCDEGNEDNIPDEMDMDWADMLAAAEERLNETDTPPYMFERGEHRPLIPVLKDWTQCGVQFWEDLFSEFDDVPLAYLRKNATCGEFMVDQGLIDRDLGGKGGDAAMEAFINNHLAGSKCDPGCSNSDLANDVDTTNFLRNIAVMAALLHQDSPLGNGNNYYLAHGNNGDGKLQVSMVQYDHNNVMAANDLCDSQCAENLVKWSILRPTCRSSERNQMAGPLLADDGLRAQYVEYVREFVADVMTNSDFQDQLHGHIAAIREDAMTDPWNDLAALYDLELADGDTWKHSLGGLTYNPFLPSLRARAAEIEKQLEAIDAGALPRDLEDVGQDEVCIDWDADGPREAKEEQGGAGDDSLICGDLELISSAAAGASCGDKDSNDGTTEAQCVEEGGSYEPYTCGDVEIFLQFDPEAEALGDEFVDYLVAEWYQPKCCKAAGGGSLLCEDLELISSAAAGASCSGGTYDDRDSNDGTTEAQCVDGGGLYEPYTCGDIANYVENDPEAKTLGDDVLNFLVGEWWRPLCCESILVDIPAPETTAEEEETNDGASESTAAEDGTEDGTSGTGGSPKKEASAGTMIPFPFASAVHFFVTMFLAVVFFVV
jgi:hypothetical protein